MGTIIIILLLLLFPLLSHAVTFTILNRCLYTVWAAAVPGGGKRLDGGESWVISSIPDNTNGRVWARTGCNFDASGHGRCQTGDCGGVLQCTTYGTPPFTLAEYTLNGSQNLDFYDMSLVDGFNVPMDFAPTSAGCRDIRCSADITGQCPVELKAAGGCNNPCTVFKTDTYCCTGSATGSACRPTDYSRYFKNRCPDAYSYAYDDKTSTFTCSTGTDYLITFCPGEMGKINLTIRIKAPNHTNVTASSFF